MFKSKMISSLIYSTCILLTIGYPISVDSKSHSSTVRNFKGSILNLRFKPVTVNVDTSKAIPYTPPTKVHFESLATATTFLVNTGRSIQTINERRNYQNVSRGVLSNSFPFVNFDYYYRPDKNTQKENGTTIDGLGYPYEIRVLYRNGKYATLAEAVQYKDGLVEVVFLYEICPVTHKPTIGLFDQKVKRIRRAGSFVEVPLDTLIADADFFINQHYYCYAGTFLDTFKKSIHQCSTVFVIKPNLEYCLSEEQLQSTFGSVKNFLGKPINFALPHDSSKLKVYSIVGVTQHVYP